MFPVDDPPEAYRARVRSAKTAIITTALLEHKGNRTRASAALHLERPYLLRLVRELGINVPPGKRERAPAGVAEAVESVPPEVRAEVVSKAFWADAVRSVPTFGRHDSDSAPARSTSRTRRTSKRTPPARRPEPTMLKEGTLYLGDNGRATCGRLKCAGATAHYSAHDLSGQPLMPLEPRVAIAENLKCEGCGMQPSLVVLA